MRLSRGARPVRPVIRYHVALNVGQHSLAVTSRSGPAGSCDQLVRGTNPVTSVIVPFLPVRALQSPAISLTFYTSLFISVVSVCLCLQTSAFSGLYSLHLLDTSV